MSIRAWRGMNKRWLNIHVVSIYEFMSPNSQDSGEVGSRDGGGVIKRLREVGVVAKKQEDANAIEPGISRFPPFL
jgi:hypothetical protein